MQSFSGTEKCCASDIQKDESAGSIILIPGVSVPGSYPGSFPLAALGLADSIRRVLKGWFLICHGAPVIRFCFRLIGSS